MDAKAYLRKIALICARYDENGCNHSECPLSAVKCGTPSDPEVQEEAIRIAESYKEPLGSYTCPRCGNKDHQEDANYCKRCGRKIDGAMPEPPDSDGVCNHESK